MPITRKALLISNPGDPGQEEYCKGVYVDIKNYQRLLASSPGGAWEDHEIVHMDRPTASELRVLINVYATRDYLFIMFTGHGWYSASRRDRILELGNGESIASLELVRGATKRTIILDCCQKVHSDLIMERRDERRVVMASERTQRSPHRAICRKHFDDCIESASVGIVKITSCAIDEVSTDDDTRGGRYNGSLIECVNDWIQIQANDQYSDDILKHSIVFAHECAASKTRTLSGGLQNPTIEKPRTSPYFPIAVFG